MENNESGSPYWIHGQDESGQIMKLTQEDLQELTGYKRPSDIEKCLASQGIRVFFGKGGRIWTTSEAVNGAVKRNAHQTEIVIDGPEA